MGTRRLIGKQFLQSRYTEKYLSKGSGSGDEGTASVRCLGMDLTGIGGGHEEERREWVQERHSHSQELYKINSSVKALSPTEDMLRLRTTASK